MFQTASKIKQWQLFLLGTGQRSFIYLSSDGAGETPHSFVRGVVFTSTSHLEGKCHCVTLNL